ncbi:MAG: hypothetical protein ABFS17_09730 [Chloroflexota bacterium]
MVISFIHATGHQTGCNTHAGGATIGLEEIILVTIESAGYLNQPQEEIMQVKP